MNQLNYHHLKYFWAVARAGSIVRATAELSVAQSTISGQIKELEESLGEKLFARVGRRLVLTETGRVVYRYADDIFSLGEELLQTLQGSTLTRHKPRVTIGIAEFVPKLIASQLIEAVFKLPENMQAVCVEGRLSHLLAHLAQHKLDIVISDAPLPQTVKIPAINDLLGESGITLCGTKSLAAKYRRGFPKSLDGAPVLLPSASAVVRRELEDWFDSQAIRPLVRGEFNDSALMKVVGQHGSGLFFVPSIIEREVKRQYGVHVVGRISSVRERFYAISLQRRFKSPALLAISARAKKMLKG